MLSCTEIHYRNSLKAATIFILFVVFMLNFGPVFKNTWMGSNCISFTNPFYDSAFLLSMFQIITGLVSFVTIVDIQKGKSTILPIFILIQFINCMVYLCYIIEMASANSPKTRCYNLCFNVSVKNSYLSKQVESLCTFLEVMFWKLLILTFAVQIYSLIVTYIFMIREDIPVSVEEGVDTLRPHVTHSPAPPSYNEAVNSISASCSIANVSGGRMTNQTGKNYCIGVHNSTNV